MSDRDDRRRPIDEMPSESAPDVDPDAPPSAEELQEAERLRDALEPMQRGLTADDLTLVASLKAAWQPPPLDESTHASLVADLPTAEELELAAELAAELEGREAPGFAVALRSAWNPTALGDSEHRAILARALGEGGGAKVIALRPRARTTGVVLGVTTAALALAASMVVWMTTTGGSGGEAPLARARSTQPLFDEPFKAGETSARIDRIASARASDYRDNRFAKWGVR